MGKVIFWIVAFFLVLLALRLVSVHQAKREARERDEEKIKKDKADNVDRSIASDTMVRCGQCGVFIPKANAVLSKTGASCGNLQCDQLTKR